MINKKFLQAAVPVAVLATVAVVPGDIVYANGIDVTASVTMKDFTNLELSVNNPKERQIESIEINKEGIFADFGLDADKVRVGDVQNGHSVDFSKARAIRTVNGKPATVMHYNNQESIVITSEYLDNIMITTKIEVPFVDVAKTSGYYDELTEAYNYALVGGTAADKYSPDKTITRGEFSAIIARALEIGSFEPVDYYTMEDLRGKWYHQEVQFLTDRAIITGYSTGNFGGEDEITREQAASVITRALANIGGDINFYNKLRVKDIYEVSDYARDSVQFLVEQRIIEEDGKFRPKDKLTRSEMVELLVPALKTSRKY
ncbi:S-layer homology domain-containing protein [Solibacillus sp. FSL K6-1523]|uniref:S-layer homology domain-containing protein n=1 Tax=Solibacillus sp. FSL K6-1523 TaxID=2921471 RepID=UPI0030F58D45